MKRLLLLVLLLLLGFTAQAQNSFYYQPGPAGPMKILLLDNGDGTYSIGMSASGGSGTPTYYYVQGPLGPMKVKLIDQGEGAYRIATAQTAGLTYKGAIDCSANPNYPAANSGDLYRAIAAGKIGGASGTTVAQGDLFFCLSDGTAAGTEAGVGASWAHMVATGGSSASALASATTSVNVSAATAPSSGQVLTATSSTAATWQSPSGGTASSVNSLLALQPIALYTMDEGAGQVVRNLAMPVPAYNENLLGFTEGFWSNSSVYSGFTATDSYTTDPWGTQTASRLTAAGAAAPYADLALGTLPAGTYTLSIYAKSNSGAQSMRFGYTVTGAGSTFSSDVVLSTSWAQYSITFTAGNTLTNVGLLNDAAHDALDISVAGFKLERGSTATPYRPATLNAILGKAQGTGNEDPSWSGGGLLFAGSGQYLNAQLSQYLTIPQISVYAAIKCSGSFVLAGYAPILNNQALSLLLSAGHAGSAANSYNATFIFGGQSTSTYGRAINLFDGNWHVVAGVYDGTNLKFYVDGALCVTRAVSASTLQLKDLLLSNYNWSAYFPGYIGALAIYGMGHTASQVAGVHTNLYSLLAAKGITVSNARNFLAFEGDSITDQNTAANPAYYWKVVTTISPKVPAAINNAISGSDLSTATSRAAALDALLDATRAHNILTVFFGANDMHGGGTAASFESALQTYCQARRAAGWKVVVATVLPQTTSGFNAKRNDANTWIRANWSTFADGLADIAGDATMGPDAAASNATYYSDGLHPTAAGQLLMEPYFTAAVNAITAN